MTAPDVNADVRARFEAHHGITWAAIQSLPIGSGSRLHLESHYKRHLDTWQAAHADLSGEVRELVEADREYDEAEAGLSRNGDGPLSKRLARFNAAGKRRSAALAQFHPTQRATNYVSGYVDDAGKFHPTHQETK